MSGIQPNIKTLITVEITPSATPAQTLDIKHQFKVKVRPIELDISEAIVQSVLNIYDTSVGKYIDEDRRLKTIVNYGNDKQSIILNQRYGTDAKDVNIAQLKLLQPVPDDIAQGRTVSIGREIAQSVIDKVRVRFASEIDNTPFLRPKNTKVKINTETGKSLRNVTFSQLSLQSGSNGLTDINTNINFANDVFRQWYSEDFNSAELNIDFTDYNNFVFYGSAAMRLAAFREKLKSLEKLNTQQNQFVNSSYIANPLYAGSTYVQQQTADISLQIENIIRNFDRYEQYLYFTESGSSSPYTASAYYADNGYEYNALGYWPKSGSALYPVNSTQAEEWFSTQLEIAQRFDEFNENNLINTIPTHIREDSESDAYITFITMVGHLFDTIKPYVDQFPYIHSKNLNPNEQLSKDLIVDIASSFGFPLPSINSINTLSESVLDTNSQESRRTLAAEIHKRLLHNFPMFTKTKGTRSALEFLLRTLGISPELMSVKETGTPVTDAYSSYKQYSTGIKFDGLSGSYIELPIAASSRTSKTLQVNCSFNSPETMTLLNGDDLWSLQIVKHPTLNNLGRLELTSGSAHAIILSSSYEELFDGNLVNCAIVNTDNSTKLLVNRLYNTEILYNSSMEIPSSSINFINTWNSTNKIYLGGSGSLVVSPYVGNLDEVRLWSSSLSDDIITVHANDPGSTVGSSYQDALYALYVQLSFNQVPFTGSISSILNESPYLNKSTSPSLATLLTNNISGTNVIKYSRDIKQTTPIAGSTTYLTSKVVVAPSPSFDLSRLDENGVKVLSRIRSIKKPETKKSNAGKNIISLTSSPTDIINENIIRTLGAFNVNNALGLPPLYSKAISALRNLREFYNKYYKIEVNINQYTEVIDQLNSVLTQVVDYFIPARASLLKGITIEPNILEQIKIQDVKEVKTYGKNTRRTLNAAGSLTSSAPDYGATFNVTDEIKAEEIRDIRANVPTYSDSVDATPEKIITGSYHVLKGVVNYTSESLVYPTFNYYYLKHIDYHTLEMAELAETNWADVKKKNTENEGIDSELWKINKFPYVSQNEGQLGAEPYGRIYSRKLFSYEINKDRIGGVTSLNIDALYDIKPSVNFTDQSTYTYFNSPSGVYYFNTTQLTPSYGRPVNFSTATTWSYGSSYNIYDVVYQNVATNDPNLTEDTRKFAQDGNKRYYVFKTRSAYRDPGDGTAYNSDSVPTYIPPFLDKDNWDPLLFTPVQKKIPKRIVFLGDPTQNNYTITTLSVDKITESPGRYVDVNTFPAVRANSYITGQLLLQNLLSMLAVQSNTSGLRVRFYRSEEARNQDISRPVGTLPTGSHGVLLDIILNSPNQVENINPTVQFVSEGSPATGIIHYTLDNLTNFDKASFNLYLYYFAYEVQSRVPKGYLPSHYRFFRDNSTAIKRRNYLGCKNTQETTFDGLPPVQIFLGEGNSLSVASSISSTAIIPSGEGSSGGTGGDLNVI